LSELREAGSLTAALLVRKGDAVAFVPRHAKPSIRLVEAAPEPKRRRTGAPRVSLRLDEAEARRLRILAAQLGLTRQATLARALAEMVERHLAGSGAGCICLATAEAPCAVHPAGDSDVRS
jgi:hypothetical protein